MHIGGIFYCFETSRVRRQTFVETIHHGQKPCHAYHHEQRQQYIRLNIRIPGPGTNHVVGAVGVAVGVGVLADVDMESASSQRRPRP